MDYSKFEYTSEQEQRAKKELARLTECCTKNTKTGNWRDNENSLWASRSKHLDDGELLYDIIAHNVLNDELETFREEGLSPKLTIAHGLISIKSIEDVLLYGDFSNRHNILHDYLTQINEGGYMDQLNFYAKENLNNLLKRNDLHNLYFKFLFGSGEMSQEKATKKAIKQFEETQKDYY